MKFSDISNVNFAKLKFIGFFSAAVILCVIILSSFWAPLPAESQQEVKDASEEAYVANDVTEIDQMLYSRWMDLQQLYDNHASALADLSGNNIDSLSGKLIMESEVIYAKLLDSVSATYSSSPVIGKIDSIVNSYRANLQNRHALNNNINAIALRNTGTSGNENQVLKNIHDQKLNDMKNELLIKNDIIAKLQSDIKEVPRKDGDSEKKLKDLQKDLQAKTATIASLQSKLNALSATTNNVSPSTLKNNNKAMDELEFLKFALRSEVSSNHALTKSVNQLKQANASLLMQLKEK